MCCQSLQAVSAPTDCQTHVTFHTQTDAYVDNLKTTRVNARLLTMSLPPQLRCAAARSLPIVHHVACHVAV